MGKINDLITEGELKAAAAIVYDTIYTIITSGSPRVNLSRAEFDKIAPELIKKMQNPVEEKEPTDAPGDDVNIVDSTKTAELKVTFDGPDGMILPKEVTKKIIIGLKYTYNAPEIEGYIAEPKVLTGKMTEEGATGTIVYSIDDTIPKHKLTINYDGPVGGTFIAPEKYTAEITEGFEYSVESPAVEGYEPDIAVVTGTMGTEDVEVTVTYGVIEPVTDTAILMIEYVTPEGVATPNGYMEEIEVGKEYSVESPAVEGCTPDKAVVTGTMSADGYSTTVTYTANELEEGA